MRPLTLNCPKPMLKVAGKPLLQYQLERLVAAGINEVVINHAWLGEQIEAFFGDGSRFGARLRYSAEGEPLETAGGIRNAIELLGGFDGEPFVVVNGDIFCDFPLEQLPHAIAGDAFLLMVNNPEHNPQGDFGLTHTGVVTSERAPGYTFSGVSVLSPRLFRVIDAGETAALGPLLREAIAAGRVAGQVHAGYWLDVGTPERLEQLEQDILRGVI